MRSKMLPKTLVSMVEYIQKQVPSLLLVAHVIQPPIGSVASSWNMNSPIFQHLTIFPSLASRPNSRQHPLEYLAKDAMKQAQHQSIETSEDASSLSEQWTRNEHAVGLAILLFEDPAEAMISIHTVTNQLMWTVQVPKPLINPISEDQMKMAILLALCESMNLACPHEEGSLPFPVTKRQTQSSLETFFRQDPELVDNAFFLPGSKIGTNVDFHGIVFPGSFNPLHVGHETLARESIKVVQQNFGLANCPLVFEISIANVDKGVLVDERVIQTRLDQFERKSWSVVLTRAPLFLDKVKLFPRSYFVIGVDTALRIVDPKYYENSTSKMLLALENVVVSQCVFLVAGRKVDSDFVSSETFMENYVPPQLSRLFYPLADFRMDISSSEIRAQRRSKGSSI